MPTGTNSKSKYRSFKVDDFGVIRQDVGLTKVGRAKNKQRELVLRVTALGGQVFDLHFPADQLARQTGTDLLVNTAIGGGT